MDFIAWTAAAGALLLAMSLSYGWISRSIVPLFGLYLLVGIVCGPWVLDILQLDIIRYSTLIEHVTEVAMAASLFMTGLKIRLPLKALGWRMGVLLAGPAMILCVGGMTLAAHYLLGFSWPLALAFSAIVAPTDPVLASLIAVSDAKDDDSLRLALSSEAGLNDGTALPLLMLALTLESTPGSIGFEEITRWFSLEVIWALLAGLGIGFVLGKVIGLIATQFRYSQREVAPSDFIALALISLSYSIALALGASGFLAAFAAGVGLRSAEVKVQRRHPPENSDDDTLAHPAETLVNPHQRHGIEEHTHLQSMGLVIGDALSFGDTVERLFAAALVIILGVTLAAHWEVQGLIMAIVLFCLIRPLSLWLSTIKSGSPVRQRLLIGWLGIRGIGSINYIAYAYTHGMQGDQAGFMVDCAITLVVASVLIHGITVTPLMSRRQKWLNQ